ncbi:CpaF family protein [Paenibacillus glycanilyticus]|uniref:Type II secretion system protein E n=1 Tax=Paenibacillus glycanilyticus TaxID=126569 RepID=A0ABQ6GGE4_9BACL|nr:CpaF family protein [Paenibacillus glycanilyticus]GLX68717.1 type II secretion system protein E [Paenibacillus glycanilyticus]
MEGIPLSIFQKLNTRLEEQQLQDQPTDYLDQLFEHYKERLLKESNLEQLIQLPAYQKSKTIEKLVFEMLVEEKIIITEQDKAKLLTMILNDSVGYGPLEPLLKNEEITEIMVNGPSEIYIERNGTISQAQITFKNNEHIRNIIERIVAPIGRRIDESSPLVDGRLEDGSRINAAIPPVSVKGPVLTIRKFRKDPYTIEDLINFHTMTVPMARFLEAAMASKLNVIISGGTGSGKTTLLNVVSAGIPLGERIITIEDSAELRLNRKNVVSLEARPANMEGTGEISIRQLVRNALRMRPDRIIVGEVRGAEAMDMLQAMNTGHEGSLTTIHANNPNDAMSRIEAMILMGNASMTAEVVRSFIASAVQLVVQTLRLQDGSRKIVSIAEAVPQERGFVLRDIFRFRQYGVEKDGKVVGHFEPTGVVPLCLEKMKAFGQTLPEDYFSREDVAWS